MEQEKKIPSDNGKLLNTEHEEKNIQKPEISLPKKNSTEIQPIPKNSTEILPNSTEIQPIPKKNSTEILPNSTEIQPKSPNIKPPSLKPIN
jgi:hypothetical protein